MRHKEAVLIRVPLVLAVLAVCGDLSVWLHLTVEQNAHIGTDGTGGLGLK
jgi:hypothetical protein